MNRDCILLNEKQADCRGLDKLYCMIEDKLCPFYKSEALYNRDGSKKRRGDKNETNRCGQSEYEGLRGVPKTLGGLGDARFYEKE